MKVVKVNKIQCTHCKDVIESVHIHDFKWCKCKTVYVDGGHDYTKRGFKNEGDYIELSDTIFDNTRKIFVLQGYSSSGKDSIMNKVSKQMNIPMLVSHTSRPMRDNEVDGASYYFVDDEFFENNKNDFLERRVYKTEHGKWHYGLHLKEIIDKPYSLLIVDRQGYEELEHIIGEDKLVSIFVTVDEDTLRERQLQRGDDTKEFERRLLDDKRIFDGYHTDYTVYNYNLEESVSSVINIILEEIESGM